MRVRLIAVGRLKQGPERDLAERYHLRAAQLARSIGVAGVDIVEVPESRARRAEERQVEEARRIRELAGPFGLALFDERGHAATSEDFAAKLRTWRDAGRPGSALVVGGPDGLSRQLRDDAEWVVSFGRMTLPHQLVRVLAHEQLYRAFTIIAGHPYHRAEASE